MRSRVFAETVLLPTAMRLSLEETSQRELVNGGGSRLRWLKQPSVLAVSSQISSGCPPLAGRVGEGEGEDPLVPEATTTGELGARIRHSSVGLCVCVSETGGFVVMCAVLLLEFRVARTLPKSVFHLA